MRRVWWILAVIVWILFAFWIAAKITLRQGEVARMELDITLPEAPSVEIPR